MKICLRRQKQKRDQKKNKKNMSSPGVSTLLLTVKLTCPLRAAACIKSITYLCGFPATTFLSTEMSSSPGRSRPSRSAGVFSIIAPITICSKTINISSVDEGEEDETQTRWNHTVIGFILVVNQFWVMVAFFFHLPNSLLPHSLHAV